MPVIIDGTNGITQAGEFNSDSSFGFKNRIINGAMVIDQRNAGASVTINSAAWTYVTDRFCFLGQSSDGVFTAQQSSTAPAGFNNSLLVTVTTADASIGANQIYTLRHTIEGFNTADLNWGTANAKTVTLSFWVRSSLTGTFGGALNNEGTRSYPFTYSISAANTWEYKTITISGDTSGTWGTTNSHGIRITWGLGVGTTYSGTAGAWAGSEFFSATGATSVVGTNGATFYITGVQLEIGSVATSFDYRPYGTELQLCQRYLPAYRNTAQDILPSQIQFNSTTNSRGFISFPVATRVPVTSMVVSSAGHFTAFGFAGSNSTLSSFTMHAGGTMAAGVDAAITGTFTTRDCATIGITNSAGFVYFNGAEL
jgi:hypothetical protein